MEAKMRFARKTLHINGADRTFIYNPAKDTLADVLRRLGLTGTKIGCNKGLCGACSVILDGEVVRSCVKKVKKIDDYADAVTDIRRENEGVGVVFVDGVENVGVFSVIHSVVGTYGNGPFGVREAISYLRSNGELCVVFASKNRSRSANPNLSVSGENTCKSKG